MLSTLRRKMEAPSPALPQSDSALSSNHHHIVTDGSLRSIRGAKTLNAKVGESVNLFQRIIVEFQTQRCVLPNAC